MDANFEKFNSLFPASQYRRIKPGEKSPLNAQLCSYEDVKNDSERVGWVVSPNYIVVDIDNKVAAEKIKNWLVKSEIRHDRFVTEHGMHFIFKIKDNKIRNSASCTTYLGIQVDYRTSGKGYIVLPFNDPTRVWNVLEDNVDFLPEVLYPVTVKPNDELLGMGDHDGRNSAIFDWSIKLRDLPGTAEMKLEALSIINNYIFNVPIPEVELDKTVLRDEMKSKLISRSNAKKSMAECEAEVAEQIMQDMIIRVVDGELIYIYNGTYYRYTNDREIEAMIANNYAPLFREANRKEVIAKIKLLSPSVDIDTDKYWSFIAFDNCILDITTMKKYEASETLFVTTHINRNFVEDAPQTEVVNEFLNHCANNDMQKRQVILEMIGDCFLRRAAFQKMYLIYGEGGTGKSTLLRIITETVGADNATFLSTKDLESTFLPAELYGKLVNIGDDIPFQRITDSSQIKKLVSGEAIMIQRKFAQPMWFSNYATMIFTTNQLPGSSDRTTGFMRRLVLIDMNVRVTDPKAFFATTFTFEDFEYLICLAVNAVSDALRRGELTQSYAVDKNLEAYKKMQSSLSEFMDDNEVTKEYLIDRSVSEVYAEYTHYCSENSMKALGKHYFVADLCSLYYLTTEKQKDEDGNVAVRFTYVTNKTN